MCQFSTLFKKLRDKHLPSIVTRVLVFVYEEQVAWIKWGNCRSEQFSIQNGTRQGSVLSPYFFAVYIDELLTNLRKLKVGCYIGGIFFGAFGYADDILLLAPCRSAMQQMISTCEDFANKYNLMFSTDDNPSKSKSKCIYMVGKRNLRPVHPTALKLYGKNLPWVLHATHLGHELHQDGTMDMDCNMKRAAFISSSSDIRSMFRFAMPSQVLDLVHSYSAHFYGSMLWDLTSNSAGMVYRSWNTCVKLIWGLPRTTHNYFVDNLLNGKLMSVRCKIMSQYVGFLKRLRTSVSFEARIMCLVASVDVRSTTGKNCKSISEEFSKECVKMLPQEVRQMYSFYPVPVIDEWRINLLSSLLDERQALDAMGEYLGSINELIESLCSS